MISIWHICSYICTPISTSCICHKLLLHFLRRSKISQSVLVHRKLWHVPLVPSRIEIRLTNISNFYTVHLICVGSMSLLLISSVFFFTNGHILLIWRLKMTLRVGFMCYVQMISMHFVIRFLISNDLTFICHLLLIYHNLSIEWRWD
jgi:hypothetical protein